MAHNSSSSRIYDVLLDSSTIPSKTKRSFVLGFIGHYHQLADDRFGSRIVDRCWNFADTYLKVRSTFAIRFYFFLTSTLCRKKLHDPFFLTNKPSPAPFMGSSFLVILTSTCCNAGQKNGEISKQKRRDKQTSSISHRWRKNKKHHLSHKLQLLSL